jgi:hypothetical protein
MLLRMMSDLKLLSLEKQRKLLSFHAGARGTSISLARQAA